MSTARPDNLARHIRDKGHIYSARGDNPVVGVEVSVSSVPDSALAVANNNCAGLFNSSMLLQAATTGDIDLLEACLQTGISIESRAGDGSTPLHCAARAGQVATVEILIQKEAEVIVSNDKKRLPLSEAIMSQSVETVNILLKDEVWKRIIGARAYWLLSRQVEEHLVRYGNREIIKAYINRQNADSDENSVVSLMRAGVHKGNKTLVDTILHHSGIDYNKFCCLHHAARFGVLR